MNKPKCRAANGSRLRQCPAVRATLCEGYSTTKQGKARQRGITGREPFVLIAGFVLYNIFFHCILRGGSCAWAYGLGPLPCFYSTPFPSHRRGCFVAGHTDACTRPAKAVQWSFCCSSPSTISLSTVVYNDLRM